jgi:transposase
MSEGLTSYRPQDLLARYPLALRFSPIFHTMGVSLMDFGTRVSMEAVMDVANHHSEQQLQRLLDRESRADLAKRLRTVLLAKQGFTAPEVATCTGFSRRSVQEWVARYNSEGLDALKTKPGRGRKPPLTPEQEKQLQQRLDAGPVPGDGICTLRGKDVQRILAQEFGQIRSLNAVYGLLHRLGYSSLVPRPKHPEADPAAQEEFKKSSASGSKKSKLSIPIAGSKSSTKTKRGLDNRGR